MDSQGKRDVMKRARETWPEYFPHQENESDMSERQELQEKTNRALFELGRKVKELEDGLEYWAAQVRAVGEAIQEALNQERGH